MRMCSHISIKRLSALLLLGGSLAVLAAQGALAAEAVLTPLGTLGGISSEGYRISADGSAITGTSYITGNAASHAFAWTSGGGMVDLGTLGGDESNPNGISSDGSVIIGISDITGNLGRHAFRWTSGGGMVDLGTLGGTESFAYSSSSDGSVIVGASQIPGDADQHAFRWTSGGGMVDLGTLGGTSSEAASVSGDGSTVVGSSYIAGNAADHAFRWTSGGGMVDLGTLGGTHSYATIISNDGNVIAGGSYITGDTAWHVFRWTSGGGMVDLGTLGGTNSSIEGLSADGSTVTGESDIAGDAASHAFRWTSGGGMVDLGTLGGTNSVSYLSSSDGAIVLGYSDTTGDIATHAFRWTSGGGMQDMNTLLADAGVNMTGIELLYPAGVSANGEWLLINSSSEAYFIRYLEDSNGVTGGITTRSAQQDSVDVLSGSQQASMMENRAGANTLLGTMRPVTESNYMNTGGMFGSALGHAGGQYTKDKWTVLGGIGYGAQDYPGIKQDNAATIATALRYTFDEIKTRLKPFAEVGGWVTPSQKLTFSRRYANGSGFATGKGSTDSTSWSEYGRGGIVYDLGNGDQLVGYGEIGHQGLRYDAYSERDNASNPFPASVDDGVASFGYGRIGGSWTKDLKDLTNLPVSATLFGAVNRSFASKNDLKVSVGGIGTMEAENENHTWGEFGAQIDTRLNDKMSLNLGFNGTTGANPMSTELHANVGVSYRF